MGKDKDNFVVTQVRDDDGLDNVGIIIGTFWILIHFEKDNQRYQCCGCETERGI